MKKLFMLILLSVFLWTGTLQAQAIKIAVDKNMWYPYTYVEDGTVKGLHIDIIKKALKILGYTPEFTPLPWKRCLRTTKNGKYDAVVSASYKSERAKYLYYPKGASSTKKSMYHITQVQYSVITNKHDSFEFDGDVKKLPNDVMAPLGYSIVDDLRKQGVIVVETSSDIDSFRKLLLAKKGCIVTLPQIANMLMQQSTYADKYYISKKNYKSKPYFIAFSKKTNISKEQREQIWNEIKTILINY